MENQEKKKMGPGPAISLLCFVGIWIFWAIPALKTVGGQNVSTYQLMFDNSYQIKALIWVFAINVVATFLSLVGDYKFTKAMVIILSLFNSIIYFVTLQTGVQKVAGFYFTVILYLVIIAAMVYDLFKEN